jgi:hypothetical protein
MKQSKDQGLKLNAKPVINRGLTCIDYCMYINRDPLNQVVLLMAIKTCISGN